MLEREQNGVDVHRHVKHGELRERVGDQRDKERQLAAAAGSHGLRLSAPVHLYPRFVQRDGNPVKEFLDCAPARG